MIACVRQGRGEGAWPAAGRRASGQSVSYSCCLALCRARARARNNTGESDGLEYKPLAAAEAAVAAGLDSDEATNIRRLDGLKVTCPDARECDPDLSPPPPPLPVRDRDRTRDRARDRVLDYCRGEVLVSGGGGGGGGVVGGGGGVVVGSFRPPPRLPFDKDGSGGGGGRGGFSRCA